MKKSLTFNIKIFSQYISLGIINENLFVIFVNLRIEKII